MDRVHNSTISIPHFSGLGEYNYKAHIHRPYCVGPGPRLMMDTQHSTLKTQCI